MPTDGPFWIFQASAMDSLRALSFQFLDRLEPNSSKILHNSASPVRSQLSTCVVCGSECVCTKPVNYLFLCASVVYVCGMWVQVCVHNMWVTFSWVHQLSTCVVCGSECVYTISELPFPVCVSCLCVWCVGPSVYTILWVTSFCVHQLSMCVVCGSKCVCTSLWVHFPCVRQLSMCGFICLCTSPWVTSAKLWFPILPQGEFEHWKPVSLKQICWGCSPWVTWLGG